MNKERLLRLASRMDKVADAHFEIGSWLDVDAAEFNGVDNPRQVFLEKAEFDDDGKIKELNFCGSTACVLGHAAQIREFQKAGLSLYARKYGDTVRDGFAGGGYVQLDNGEYSHTGNEAGAIFFDIPESHASVMFATGGPRDGTDHFYETKHVEEIKPKHVAAALRKYVETDGQSMRVAVKAAYEALGYTEDELDLSEYEGNSYVAD